VRIFFEIDQEETSLSYWIYVWVPVLILLVVLDLCRLQIVGFLDLNSPSERKPANGVSVGEEDKRGNTFFNPQNNLNRIKQALWKVLKGLDTTN